MSSQPVVLPLFPDPPMLERHLVDKKFLPEVYQAQALDWAVTAQFLIQYKYAYETYKSYRREVERFLLWVWSSNLSLGRVGVPDIQRYIDFVNNIPSDWSMPVQKRRYLDESSALINPEWRPFVRSGSAERCVVKNIFSILSSFFNYLIDHDVLHKNPIKLLKQKKHMFVLQPSERVVRKLSSEQWRSVVDDCAQRRSQDPVAMRDWWMLGLFYLLGVRISELASDGRHEPCMRDFWVDEYGQWWFKALGKGNKYREIAVPQALVDMFFEYRSFLGLSPHMGVSERVPLLPKLKGVGGLGVRQVRMRVTACFKIAAEQMRRSGKLEDAAHLEEATVHWLRHTSISEAVKKRPLEHVRDDAGHSSIMITDLYIDTDRHERHRSAKNTKLYEQS